MNQNRLFAEVILPLPMRQTYSYNVPPDLADLVKPGKRVIVQFGSRKMYTGLIHSLHNSSPETENIKDILEILDEEVLITSLQLQFWEWMADYYMCTPGEVFKAALPSGLKLESQSRLLINAHYDAQKICEKSQQLIYDIISKNDSISIDDLLRATGRKSIHSQLKVLMDQGAVFLEERIRGKYKPKTQTYVSLKDDVSESEISEMLDSLSRAPRQKDLLNKVLMLSGYENDDAAVVDIPFENLSSEFNSQIINSLIKRGFLQKKEIETGRFAGYSGYHREPWPLERNQQEAFQSILDNFRKKNVVLLHGVTSSGKTEIYIHLMKKIIEEEKQVLYLLPEIALTSQIVNRLKEVFGDDIGVYHSRFSDAERVEVYKDLKEKKYRIILGVRSAVFLPFSDLGLIIIDEEHENTFKQFDPAPRYHARDAAIILASMFGANVLLGTATPSVESYTNAIRGKYGLVKLEKRYGDVLMPEILVADLRMARRKREMKSVFTPVLLHEIESAMANNRQVILFQNRRGYSSFLECEHCGWVPRCTRCDVSLTYHKFQNRLNCHYCGYSINMPHQCKECGSTRLLTRGFGTELIEDELNLLVPGIRIGRLDLDTSRSRKGYEKILEEFGNGKLDILVGTQMLSKGLDFERVSLVGIVSADQMLNFPDFRAFERSFQLMAQVSGRAGRKGQRGKVIIQTAEPAHPVVRYVINNDYAGMYKDQVYERQDFAYPPFVRMIRFTLRSKELSQLNVAAGIFAGNLRKTFGKRVLGPQPPVISRVKTYYLQQIILKIEKKASFSRARKLIREIIAETESADSFKKVRINIDVDPA